MEAQLSDFLVQPIKLANIQHLSLENAPLALGLAVGQRVVDALYADAIDTVSFRSPNANIITGLGVTNVSTVVETVNIRDSVGASHGISFIGDALDGDADAVQINLTNVVATSLELEGAYELATINSVGPVANSFALIVDTLEELTIIGNQDLSLAPMEIDPLVLVDASEFTGDLSATFVNNLDAGLDGINDVIEVIGGSGDDELTFGGSLNSDVTVSGGDGDDEITFSAISGQSSFDMADGVDGGDGNDDLRLDVRYNTSSNDVDLLRAGVGSNIVGIERIVHFSGSLFGDVWDNLIVDWSRSGSATELELAAADYNNNNVTVTNLASDDFVIVSGNNIGTLSLSNVNRLV